jgi:glycosyltransferase involved in cell wall biosynthesis
VNKERIRLLITDDSLPLGGKETLLLQQLEHLDRDTFEVYLVTQTDKGELLPQARKMADHYFCLHRRCGLDLSAIHRLRRYMVEHSIDIIHTNAWIDSLYVWLAAGRFKVKKIATIHGYNYTWRHHVNLWVLKSFDCIMCVSKSLKIELYKMGLPWKKLSVVYNCFDHKRFKKIRSPHNNENNIPFRTIMVANFRWIKDQETVIRATKILEEKGYKIELHLVGGVDIGRLEACQRLVSDFNLNDSVFFYGQKRVDGDFLSRFDLFIFSSLADTFGIALLEAMACGLPVLVSDIPPSMELIQHGQSGCFFATGNASSCADGILRFMKDQNLRKAMGEKAYLRAKDFTPNKIVRNLELLYLYVMELNMK